jgi:hypothetical protein
VLGACKQISGPWATVSAGRLHTCGIHRDGTLWGFVP